MKTMSRALALVLTFGLFIAPAAPVFALGELPPDPTPPVVDLCPNIDGPQASIPSGMVLDGSGNCITPDTTPPVISGVANQSLLSTAATIVWTTDDLSISTFEYGTTQSYGSSASISASLGIGGTAILTGLTPATTYYYCIHATNAATLASQSCSSFATAAAADTTGPVISGVASVSLLSTTAEIAWETNELAVSALRYGTTESLGSTGTIPATALLVHGAVLTGLTPATTYHYCIDATDIATNITHSCGHTFTTAAASGSGSVDTNPPTISVVSATSITSSAATITWTTNEVADAQVSYGLTSDYDSTTTLDTNLALTHSTTLSGLTPNTLYHYRVRSSDELGNVAVTSDETFTTAPLSGSGSSGSSGNTNVSSVAFSSIESTSITETGVTITWNTNLSSDSQVEYGDSELFGSATSLSSTLTTSHSVSISNLTPNTNYIFRVKSKPAGVSVATVSTNYEFNTLAEPVFLTQPANVTSVAASSITTSAASITWNTDAGVTSQVEYGISSAYGQTSAMSNSLVTSHSVGLSNLTQNTTYHYRVKSVTVAGDITYSDDHTFTTATVPGSVGQAAPIEVGTLSVFTHDQTSVTLTWHVDGDADAAAQYEIRYATFQINSASYAQATLAQETAVDYVDLSPNGISRTYIVAGLEPNTNYYFAIKSKYQHSDWSGISNITSVTTLRASAASSAAISGGGSSGGGGGGGTVSASHAPTVTSAEGEDGQIVFNWKNPTEDSYVHTVIVRKKEGSYPTSPTDGEAIYEGRSETFTDTNLENGKTYYYSIYSYDHAKKYSTPVHVSLSPKGGVDEVKLRQNAALVSTGPIEHFTKEYKKGDKDIEIEHLQQLLIAQGVYNHNRVTGYFGTYTETGLKKLQSNYKLPQSGITDAATRNLLTKLSQEQVKLEVPEDVLLFSTNQRVGAQGDAVEALQEFLIREGSYSGKVTGSFDATTKTAVMAFQKKYNVQPVSGYVGPKTRHVMQTISGL